MRSARSPSVSPTSTSRSSTSTRRSLPGKPANVQGLLFREQEVGYLVGYLAGLEEKRRAGADAISAVGGFKEPPVDRFIAGYFAGAEKAAPGITTSGRLLAGLGRPGEVQGARAEPDRARLEGRLPGRRRLRPRRAARGRGADRVGHRRRRRPVVPRRARPDERAEGRRRGGLPHDQVDPGRHLAGRRQRHLRARAGRRRARDGQPEVPTGGRRPGRSRSSSRSPTARSPTSPPSSARADSSRRTAAANPYRPAPFAPANVRVRRVFLQLPT